MRSLFLPLILAGISTAVADPAMVDPDNIPGTSIETVHQWLRLHNPALQALALDASAAQELAQSADALPNPSFAIELNDISSDRPRLLPGQVGSTRYALRQSLPLWGKRKLAREQALAETRAIEARHDAGVLTQLAQADSAYVGYWQALRAAAVLDRILARLTDLRQLAQTRYASGLAPQQDALQAEVELTRMHGEQIRRQAAGQAAAALLNAALGRAPLAALAEPAGIPDLPVNAALDQLLSGAVAEHPAVLTDVAMAAAAEQERQLIQRERLPDLNMGLALIQDGDRLRAWELMFEINIPLQRSALGQREHAALLRRDAADARRVATEYQIRGALAAAHARWRGALAQRQLIESTLLIEAETAYLSALTSYGNSAVDFGTLLQALKQSLAAEMDRVDALESELLAAAEVRALTGEYQ